MILVCLIRLPDFIVAASKFAVNEMGRGFSICGHLEHFSGLGEASFVTKDVTKIFGNVGTVWKYCESLFEDFDSDIDEQFAGTDPQDGDSLFVISEIPDLPQVVD